MYLVAFWLILALLELALRAWPNCDVFMTFGRFLGRNCCMQVKQALTFKEAMSKIKSRERYCAIQGESACQEREKERDKKSVVRFIQLKCFLILSGWCQQEAPPFP